MKRTRIKLILKILLLGFIFIFLCSIITYHLLIPALICIIYGFIEPYLVENKETCIINDKIPEEFRNFKILFVSDIHHGIVYSKKRVKKLVKRLNDENPDIIFLGGDYVDEERYITSLFNELQNLKAKHGVYGVLGNHDHGANPAKIIASMTDANITCLNNKGIWLNIGNSQIRIGGVGDFWRDKPDISPTINGVNDEFVILISHNPDYAEDIKTDKIDLVLSGHTHGGQATLFGLWAPFIPSIYGQKYKTGLVKAPRTEVLISNGVGNVAWCIPIRFFARPQINIIYLNKKYHNIIQ